MDDIINNKPPAMEDDFPRRRVQRVRHELKRRDLQVVRTELLSPNFVAVTFAGESLADFISDSFDDHVKLLFPAANGDVVGRDYTPRAFDRARQRLTIEFAMHGDGIAERWARQARVGERLLVGGPRGSMIIPADHDWHLLVGDASALPAIHRRLEELPDAAKAIVVARVAPEDRRALPRRPGLELHWVSGAADLVEVTRALALPSGEGFAWAAGEATLMAQVRQVVLQEKRHPKEAARIAAYWKQGSTAHHENLE